MSVRQKFVSYEIAISHWNDILYLLPAPRCVVLVQYLYKIRWLCAFIKSMDVFNIQ